MSRITRKLNAIRVHFSRSCVSFPCLPVTRRKSLQNRFVSSGSGAMHRHIRVLDNLLSVSLGGKHLSSCVLYRLAAQEAAQRDPGYASQYRRRPRLAGLSGLGDWTSFGGEVRANLGENRARKIFVDRIVLSVSSPYVLVSLLCRAETLHYHATLPSKKYLLPHLLPCRSEEKSNFFAKSGRSLLYVQFARLPLENAKQPNRKLKRASTKILRNDCGVVEFVERRRTSRRG